MLGEKYEMTDVVQVGIICARCKERVTVEQNHICSSKISTTNAAEDEIGTIKVKTLLGDFDYYTNGTL